MKKKESRWIKCISTHGSIRGVAIEATQLVREMAKLHNVSGRYAQGLGEAVMGALTIASYCKEGERTNLNVQGSGDFSQALVDAYPNGTVRGYVVTREPEQASFGDNNDLGPWGEGLLSVLRTKQVEGQVGSREPYIGTVPLVTGHLAKDLTFYWSQSEQVPSAVGLSVQHEAGQVVSATAFLVQTMPQASKEEAAIIEKHVEEINLIDDRATIMGDPMQVLAQIFQSTPFIVLEEKPLRFECSCSLERVERALALAGAAELKEILRLDRKASVRCDFCTKEYVVNETDLKRLIELSR